MPTSDKQHVATYVEDEKHREIKSAAQAQDLSISKWVHQAIDHELDREGMKAESRRYKIEERLMELVDESADRAADRIVEQIMEETGPDESIPWGTD